MDIGGCLGSISTLFASQNTRTKIIIYEPDPENFILLLKNIEEFPNIEAHNIALGNGEDLFFFHTDVQEQGCYVDDRGLLFNGLVQSHRNSIFVETLGGYRVSSKRLVKIFTDDNIQGRICLKIDTEGGERFLLGDGVSTEMMKVCDHIAMEVHFPPTKANRNQWFNNFPNWESYDTWVRREFTDYHIKYHYNSKKSGVGTYVMTRKNFWDTKSG